MGVFGRCTKQTHQEILKMSIYIDRGRAERHIEGIRREMSDRDKINRDSESF